MKKYLIPTIAITICSANFIFAGIDSPEIQNKGLFFKNEFQYANSFSTNLPSQKLVPIKRKGGSSDAFEEGVIVITAGYGFPNLGKSVLKLYDSYTGYKVSGFGPLSFKGEYGISDKIGFGLSINYVSFSASWIEEGYDVNNIPVPYTYTFSRTSISVLGRMNIHFATSEKLDPYWGVGAGYRSGNYKFTSSDPDYIEDIKFPSLPFGFETTIGLRYYFTDNIGAYVEMGYAKALIQAGLALKF